MSVIYNSSALLIGVFPDEIWADEFKKKPPELLNSITEDWTEERKSACFRVITEVGKLRKQFGVEGLTAATLGAVNAEPCSSEAKALFQSLQIRSTTGDVRGVQHFQTVGINQCYLASAFQILAALPPSIPLQEDLSACGVRENLEKYRRGTGVCAIDLNDILDLLISADATAFVRNEQCDAREALKCLLAKSAYSETLIDKIELLKDVPSTMEEARPILGVGVGCKAKGSQLHTSLGEYALHSVIYYEGAVGANGASSKGHYSVYLRTETGYVHCDATSQRSRIREVSFCEFEETEFPKGCSLVYVQRPHAEAATAAAKPAAKPAASNSFSKEELAVTAITFLAVTALGSLAYALSRRR